MQPCQHRVERELPKLVACECSGEVKKHSRKKFTPELPGGQPECHSPTKKIFPLKRKFLSIIKSKATSFILDIKTNKFSSSI